MYLLSGGIEQFLEEFNDLVEGVSVPQPPKKSLEESKQRSMELSKKKHDQCKEGTTPPRKY